MADMMQFPKTVEEFMEQYKIVDTEQVYTNGAELVPIFRMEQWFAHQANTPRWIPVTDGLPEEDYETGNGVQFSADVLATIVNHKNDGELYVWLLKTVDGKWYDYIPNEDGAQEVPYGCEVIAWMPLPDAYKGGGEEC